MERHCLKGIKRNLLIRYCARKDNDDNVMIEERISKKKWKRERSYQIRRRIKEEKKNSQKR